MKLAEFQYELPRELIAQVPLRVRDQSRLMVVDRPSGEIRHSVFSRIGNFLGPGDLVVLNDTRVVAARLVGRKASTGGTLEMLLVRERSESRWEAIVRPLRRAKVGEEVVFDGADVCAQIVDKWPGGRIVLEFPAAEDAGFAMSKVGRTPLPPYIRRDRSRSGGPRSAPGRHVDDARRYQTVFARRPGSIAAPTAGLHFTRSLLRELRGMGVRVAYLTLHVGPGTFIPIREEDVERHRMEEEHFAIPSRTARMIGECRRAGGRIVAAGTSTTRALEHAARQNRLSGPVEEWTDLFIYPGFEFRAVDVLITNLHLPGSTLLLLVSAFAGRRLIARAYREAIARRYRFYSYGDAMLIV